MAEAEGSCGEACATDWAGNARSLAAIWGLPGLAMLASAFATPAVRTLVWTAALVWMGTACLTNARRCGRIHCRYTGPFFLAMAVLMVLDTAGMLPLGPEGWKLLGAITLLGNALIWWGSERLLGRFLGAKKADWA